MNKIQYVKLLNLRGVTELRGETLAEAVKRTGGEPTEREMVDVNYQSMVDYIYELEEQKKALKELEKKNKKLISINNTLEERDAWLTCLENAGVGNWSGIEEAAEMLKEFESSE